MTKYTILKEFNQILINVEDIISDNTTTNITLDKLARKILPNFIGVYSADTYPHYVRDGQCFIINTDPSYRSGMHWLGVYKYKSKFYIFDSFNRPIQSLSKFFKNKTNIVSANRDRDESFCQKNCGQLSLSWIIMASKYNPKVIMNII